MTRPAFPPPCPRCGSDAARRKYVIVAQDAPPLNLYPCRGVCEDEVREAQKLTAGHVYEYAAARCSHCDGSGHVRNDGFVWVRCPDCKQEATTTTPTA